MPNKGLEGEDNRFLNISISADEVASRAMLLRPKYSGDPYALAQIDRYDTTSPIYQLISLGIQATSRGDWITAAAYQDQVYYLAKQTYPLSDEELIDLKLGPASAYDISS